MRLRRAARVILIGAPGVGKGTQSERLLARFPQLSAISSGDLLRQNVKSRTPLGIKVERTVKTGGLVSDDIILRLITNELNHRGWLAGGRPNVMTLSSSSAALEEDGPLFANVVGAYEAALDADPLAGATLSRQALEDPAASFLLDGFPRTAAQAKRLDGIVPINWAVSIRTPFHVIMRRIASRWVHEPSGRVYNTSFNAPKVPGFDDITGDPLVQRADDSEEVYRARFQKFQETSEPLLEHYAKKGVLWEVDGLSSDEISPKLHQEFERRFL
ncbi:adenylate kinase [Durotheca rogersii]|uniref:adenylate kinase n=1 Tax=Durotheca rogersii TaxID=419775 RepID=UPI00221EA5FD|nr:adenylate kinase [Durotheca rogersii]KAI5864737.1 adenylate kinase [Durotheca rogersii]